MTVRDLFAQLGSFDQGWLILVAVLFGPPLVVLGLRLGHGRGRGGNDPWRWLYALLIFAVAIPGVCAAVVAAWGLIIERGSLMDVPLAALGIVAVPIVGMVLTLGVARQTVDLDRVPGFDRITSLLSLLGIAFLVVLLLRSLRFFVFSSLWGMLGAGAFLYFVMRWALGRVLRGPGQPKEPPPTLPRMGC